MGCTPNRRPSGQVGSAGAPQRCLPTPDELQHTYWSKIGNACAFWSKIGKTWCIVESEDRPRAPGGKGNSSYWNAAADRNERYARCHGYGFAYIEPYWCKISAVAHVLQNGINGRRCSRVVFLDSDVQIVNYSMSLDEYLERGRSLGDEALIMMIGRSSSRRTLLTSMPDCAQASFSLAASQTAAGSCGTGGMRIGLIRAAGPGSRAPWLMASIFTIVHMELVCACSPLLIRGVPKTSQS